MKAHTLSFISALDSWSAPHPGRSGPEVERVSILQQAGCKPGSVWTGEINGKPNEGRTQNRPACNDCAIPATTSSWWVYVLSDRSDHPKYLTRDPVFTRTHSINVAVLSVVLLMPYFKFKYFEGAFTTHTQAYFVWSIDSTRVYPKYSGLTL
jgi:hypothetical protein